MKHPSERRSFFCRAAQRAAVLIALVILAWPHPLFASLIYFENGYSSVNTLIGENDFKSGDPIVTGSGSIDYALPLFNLGGPMGLSCALKYNRAIFNWWSETRNYFPTHGGANYFWLPPLSASVNWDTSGYDVILPGGEKASFLKTGDTWALNEVDTAGYRENALPIRYAAATSGNPANRFWILDPSRDRLLVYDYAAGYGEEGKLVYVMDRNGNKLSYTYDGGRITEITDGLGRTLRFAYDTFSSQSYLYQISDRTDAANPRTVTFAYDTVAADMNNQPALRAITDALGNTHTFRWSVVTSSGTHYDNLAKVENPKGGTYFHFQNVWDYVGYKNAEGDPLYGIKVVSQKDADGNETTFSYNEDPYVTRATYPDSSTGAYAHNDAHVPPSQFTDAEGNPLVLTKNDRNQVTAMTDRTGGATQVTYHEPTGKLAAITNADGKILTFTYTTQTQTVADPDTPANTVDFTFYNLTKIDYPDETSETFTYDAKGNMTAHTDRTGKTWNYTCNHRGQVLTATNPEGGVTTYTYDVDDATLASSTDSDTGVTTYIYDAYKRLTRITRPGGATVLIAYDLNNQVTSITDERGKKYDYAYDANGNLNAITDPDTKQTLFRHDFMDRVDEVTNARGKKSQYAYDNMNRQQSVTDPNGNTIQYGYNSRGWMDKVTDGGGHEWTTGFDNEGLPTSESTPLGRTTTITRDALGHISKIKNPLEQETAFTRNEMSRVTKITDALTRETSFSYDNAGRLTGVTLPLVGAATYRRNGLGVMDRITDLKGSVWNFSYTNMGRLASLTDPLSKLWEYDYDTRGRLNQVTYPGGPTQTRTYDDAGNLLRSLYSAGPDLNFTYDNQNRLLSAEDIAFTYNETGQVTATTNPGTTFGATYDDGGRLKTVTYANDLFAVTYTYDARDLLTRVTDSLTGTTIDFTYDNDGRLTGVTRPNGINTTFTWDAASRLTRLQHGALADLQYTHNAAGEITRLEYNLPLDPAEYLTSGTDSLTFDAASQVTTAGYAYDNQGRQTASPGQTYTWDGATRLTATAYANLTYNGLNNLVTRQQDGTTVHYYYNYAMGNKPLVAEYNETASSWKRFYVLTPGGKLIYLIEAANDNGVAFYYYDHIGNTLFLTNPAGDITDTYAYSPYGKLLAHEGTSDQPFTFVGTLQVRQEGSNGLYQMRARYYHANLGRFMSREPLWPLLDSPMALNPYQYALNNPLTLIDITGRFAYDGGDSSDTLSLIAFNMMLYMNFEFQDHEEHLLNAWDRLSFEERLKILAIIQRGLIEAKNFDGFKWNDRERAIKFLNKIHKKQLELKKAGKRPDIPKAGWNAKLEKPKGGKAVEKPDANIRNEFCNNPESQTVKPVSFAADTPNVIQTSSFNQPQSRALDAARANISSGEKLAAWALFWQEANHFLDEQ